MKKERIISAADYRKHPAWFTAVNSLWSRMYGNGSSSYFTKDELIMAARRGTGLHNFGSDFWDEPLDRLILSLNEEADLHPIGAFITRKRIVNLLSVRLRAEYWFKKYPAILDQELYPPLVIVGLQRTGTTKLHRLLAADPDNRVLKSWEAINPAPLHRDLNGKERRIRAARMSEKALRRMAPGFFAIHPVEFTAPEEDILLLDVTFLSTTPEAITHVPGYSEWLDQTDQAYAYEYGSRLLKFLQWQQPGKRWILKSPHHLEFMGLIEQYYGTPTILWTHRELEECIPSFLSMVCHSRALFSDGVRFDVVAEHWTRKTSHMLEKGLAYRNSGNNRDRIIDILYERLVDNAMEELNRVYGKFGGISGELAARLRKAEEENPKGKYGIHQYLAADFGLTGDQLKQMNPDYAELLTRLRTEDQEKPK